MKTDLVEEYSGIRLIASNLSQIESIRNALSLLEKASPHEGESVVRWVDNIAFTDTAIRWSHFCDGIVFLWSGDDLPANVLASYLYRCAVEICLFKRFTRVGFNAGNAKFKFIACRRELGLMKKLNCDAAYLARQEQYVAELLKKCSK